MAQNIYDDPDFFEGYAKLNRSIHGLEGAPEWPALNQMLPNLAGLNIADLGCGYGWFCRRAKEAGANKVTGFDLSEKMIARAKEMTADEAISYLIADIETLKLPEASFDLIYSSLTLHYIEHLSELLEVVYQALKPKGYFIFSVEHPIYTAATEAHWIKTDRDEKAWPVNHYQDEGRRVSNWLAPGVIKQHRTMGTYLNLLISLGFTIKNVEEWGPTKEQIEEAPELAEERERPMLLLVSVCK